MTNQTIEAEIKKAEKRGKARVKQTGEVFTPMDLCRQMVHEIPKEKLKDPNTTYLDNSCGDGNFLAALYEILTKEFGHDGTHVLNHQLYGVDLMPDNISTVRDRLGILPDMEAWNHIVCADALNYDYLFEPESQTSMAEELGAR
jgi:type I restriction-modification system DNA methylase subunit